MENTPEVYDAKLYRERMQIGWDEVADDYEVITVPFLVQYLPRLIELSDLGPNQNVLDVGTGSGLAAIAAAEKILPDGRVLATDLSDHMLDHARAGIETKQVPNVDVFSMPAEELDIHPDTFDRVISNFGISFFQDPPKALTEMHRVLKDEGRVALSTWATADKCLVLGLMDTIVKRNLPELQETIKPSIFDFGTDELFTAILKEAGFTDIQVHHETNSARYKKAEDYWDKLYRTGPDLRETLSELPKETIEQIRNNVLEEVEKHRQGDKIILRSEALIAIGTK
jgi:ubiquinone/menaquinone biosynthesis C-methylase UbiE